MAWLSKTKSLTITQTTDYKCTTPGTIGQAPAQTNISFTPFDLFGAAERCSHLHYVDPTAVTPESLIAKALIEHYVDDTSTDFSILSTADKLKDFVKSSFVGTVAAAVSYLTMIRNGYQWTDHFENVTGGNSGVTRAPDFVFAGQGKGHPLVESKGTRAQGHGAFSRHPEMDERPSGLEPLSGDIIDEAMTKYTERPAAIFPDGLAVFDMRDIVQTSVEVRWDSQGFRQD